MTWQAHKARHALVEAGVAMKINITGTGYPLVLFHGWGFDQLIWESLTREIARRYTVVAVDLPGFGQSPVMSWAAFKARILEHLPQQFAIAGWSLGGLYATRLALETSARVTHLINIASSPRFTRDDNWPGVDQRLLNMVFRELKRDPVSVRAKFIAMQSQHQTPQSNPDYLPSAEGLKAGLDVLAEWDLREALHKLNIPVCYMFGHLDTITPKATMTNMQSRYPHFNYVSFPKAAHMPFMTHQKKFIKELERFIPCESRA
ncbi:alpha/beta fold hydrolase [Legionella sp. CNM-4043-24]|uniref:alpha/beta fold hydrolase n=1 Tax=Legionella sp. CNM-4043-24 TaxID=3421646 RepID=UPI00403AA9B3